MSTIQTTKTLTNTITGTNSDGSVATIPDGLTVNFYTRTSGTTTWSAPIAATTKSGVASTQVTLALGTYDFMTEVPQQTVNNVTYSSSTDEKDSYDVTVTVTTKSVITIS